MKAFITGISGFTGKHLVELLKSKRVEVTGIDNNSKTRYIRCDLTDKKKLTGVILEEKPDYIFHLASPILRSDKLINESLQKNLVVDLFGSVNLIQAVTRLKKSPQILITGSNAEYKMVKNRPIKETDRLEAMTTYGLSKLTQEIVCRQLAKSYGLRLVYTRTFHLVGPGQKPGFVVTDFCKKVAEIEVNKSKAGLSVGNLQIKRDFTDVRDTVRAYWLLMQQGKPGEVYNVCSGKSYSIKQVVDWLIKNSRKKVTVKQKKHRFRKNDPQEIVGDNKKLKKITGWKPEISWEKSLKDTLDYWRSKVARA